MTESLCRGCLQPFKARDVLMQQVKVKQLYEGGGMEIERMQDSGREIYVHKKCMKFRRNL